MSKNLLIESLNQPDILEEVYRNSPREFEAQLKEAIEQNSRSETLRIWNARLSYCPPVSPQRISISLLIALCLITGFIAKIPAFFPVDSQWYYPRFIPLIVVSAIIVYFLKLQRPSKKTGQ